MALVVILKDMEELLIEEGLEDYRELPDPCCYEYMAPYFDGETEMTVIEFDGGDQTGLLKAGGSDYDFWVREEWVKEAF